MLLRAYNMEAEAWLGTADWKAIGLPSGRLLTSHTLTPPERAQKTREAMSELPLRRCISTVMFAAPGMTCCDGERHLTTLSCTNGLCQVAQYPDDRYRPRPPLSAIPASR